MQDTLFPEINRQELAECVGILAPVLLILNNILHSDHHSSIVTAIKNDQQEASKARALLNGRVYQGCGAGRHMNPEVVLAFLVARAYYPDCFGERGFQYLLESESLKDFLAQRGINRFPGKSTIHDQISSVSDETLFLLNQITLQYAKHLAYDDMSAAIIDSTAIAANSAWPVDSSLLKRLGFKLSDLIGIAHRNLTVRQQRSCSIKQVQKDCQKLFELDLYISSLTGKKGAPAKREKAYDELLDRCERVICRLNRSKDKLFKGMALDQKNAFEEILKMFTEKTSKVNFRFGRAPEGYNPKASQAINSFGDNEGAFIKKGGRETVFGYRPSFSFSINGFIVCYTIELGNTADSKAFPKILKEHQKMTGEYPVMISVDDGYASKKNLTEAIKNKACVISFSGSKGKAVLGDALYEEEEYRRARHIRSASEAGISQLKNTHDFKRFSVSGIERTRQELSICMFGFNLQRIVTLALRSTQQKVA